MITILGDIFWDIHLNLREKQIIGTDTRTTIMPLPGGSARNTAVWAARSGAPTTLLGKVGDDPWGKALLGDLAEEGVIAEVGRAPDYRTGMAVVITDTHGNRSFYTDRGANAVLSPADYPDSILADSDWLHISGYTLIEEGPRVLALWLAKQAKRSGIRVSLDPGSFKHIERISRETYLDWCRSFEMIFPNYEEGKVLTGCDRPETIVEVLARSFATVVLKLGKDGILLAHRGITRHVAAPAVQVLDTTGAGDALAGVFIAKLISGGNVVEAASLAVEAASRSTKQLGATPRIGGCS